jgi:hypothetical protein
MSSTAMPNGDVARVAASAGAQLDPGQRLMRLVGRDFFIGQRRLKPQDGVIGL